MPENSTLAMYTSDINSLRAMMTDDMLREIKTQLAERESHTGAGANKTEVQMLDAKLLGIEEMADVFEVITGIPHCIASNGGKPNPSKKDM